MVLIFIVAITCNSVTALLHGDRDPSIAGMVLDSPFADLTQLCEEMVEKARDHGINVPGFVTVSCSSVVLVSSLMWHYVLLGHYVVSSCHAMNN